MRIRTGFSFKTAVGHLEEVADRLVEIGWKVAPISDRVSTFGFTRWTKIVEKKGLRPIYGVELPVVPELGAKKPIVDYWTFFALDSLRELHAAVELSTAQGGLTYPQALSIKLPKITGERTLLDNIGKKLPSQLYFGLSPSTPVGLYRAAKKRGMKFIATGDNLFPRKEDVEFYRIAIGMRASTQTYPQYILSDDEWKKSVWYADAEDVKKALSNRDLVMKKSVAMLRRASLLTPPKPKSLRALCEDGAKKLGVNLKDPVYKERIDRELAMIEEKKFEDYFFIIADLMQYARTKMVVGPARGSSCGSLACYLLGITSIDPIPYGLIFERFIDRTRADLPDIDLDFSDAKRHIAIEYIYKKYGSKHVARLGSVSMHQSKSALKAIGIALRIPSWQINEVSNTVIKRSMGDSRAGSTVIDTMTDTDVGRKMLRDFPQAVIAGRLEEHPSNAGQHAAGVVLTQDEVVDFVAVDKRNGVAMCDKYDAEALNLLKIDMLGLTQLSTFERVLELIGKSKERSAFFEKIPLDDPEAFNILNDFKFSGVFQFVPDSALANLVRRIRKDFDGRLNHVEDLISLTALVRPGPLGSGMTDEWIRRRAGKQKVEYEHPILEPHLKNTLGLVVYQEQIMSIGRDIGDLTWDDVTALRKAMSKSLGKEYFDQFGDRWKAGAIKRGMSPRLADSFWDRMCQFGMWSFNRSHSVAYGLISYWCCWLKVHYPVEFAAATLDAESEQMRQVAALREMKDMGVDYVAFDRDVSTDRWEIGGTNSKPILVGPLSNIHGIGPAIVRDVIDARAAKKELRPSVIKKLTNAQTKLTSLTPIADAVEKIVPDLSAVGILTKPTPVDSVVGGDRGVVIIARVTKVQPVNENEPARQARRKGYGQQEVLPEPADALNMFFEDDTGEIFCKISYRDFQYIGKNVAAQAKVGKSLFAVKGDVPKDFRMIRVSAIKYLGDMSQNEPRKTST